MLIQKYADVGTLLGYYITMSEYELVVQSLEQLQFI
jgi:hypothetical protein